MGVVGQFALKDGLIEVDIGFGFLFLFLFGENIAKFFVEHFCSFWPY